MTRRLLRLTGWTLLALLLLTLAAVAYFTATESGLQRLLTLAQRYAPGELSWDAAHGRVLGPLDLRNLNYHQADGFRIELAEGKLRWRPADLLARTLRIDQLHLHGLDVYLPPPTTPAPPAEPLTLPNLRLPLGIDLKDIDLSAIRIHPWQAPAPIVIEQLRLAASGTDATVQVVTLEVRAPELTANLAGTVQPSGDYPLDLTLAWQYTHPQFGAFDGNGAAKGDLKRLELTHTIAGIAQLQLEATVVDLLRQPGWDARLELHSDNLEPFAAALAQTPLQAEVTSQGTLERFDARARLTTHRVETGPLQLELDAEGGPETITVRELLLKPSNHPGQARLRGTVDRASMRADLNLDWLDLGWPLVGSDPQYLSPKGSLNFVGDAEAFSAKLRARLDGPLLGALDASLDANGEGPTLTVSQLALRAPDGAARLTAQGTFDRATLSFDTRGEWQALGWPLRGEPQFASKGGRFNANGTLGDYQFDLTAALRGAAIPSGEWQLQGKGSTEALRDFTLNGQVLTGELTVAGNAAWLPQPAWQVALNGKGLNPGAQWPELAGKLNLDLRSAGSLGAAGPDLSAEIATLSGEFRGQPVRGQGKVLVRGSTLDLEDIRLSSGGARLEASGRLSDDWDLRWRLDAPNLAQLLPDLGGAIQGSGTLGGTAAQPRAALELKATDLAAGATTLKRLDANARIDLAATGRSVVEIKGTTLGLAGQPWRALTLNGAGTPGDHVLTLTVDGEPGNLELALAGGLSERQWLGNITTLAARKTAFGDWTLAQPAPLQIAAEAAQLAPVCLASAPTRLCVDGSWNAATGARGELSVTDLEAKRFATYLPDGIRLDTALAGKASGQRDSQGLIRADADFQLRPGQLALETNGAPLRIQLGDSHLRGRLDGQQASAALAFDLGALGRIDADTQLSELAGTPRLGGTLKARLDDLAPLSALAPQLQAIGGRFDADLTLGGTLATPALRGDIRLSDFSAEVPAVAIRIEDGTISARSDGPGPLSIAGSARSGPGTLALAGQLDPATRALQMTLTGKDFQVANAKSARARISPDLKLALDGQGMRVNGTLRVPQAYFNAKGAGAGQQTVAMSSDVVIVEANGQPEPARPASPLNLDLRIELGEDIQVEAGEFRGALKGNLQVVQTPELAPRGTGTIEIVNGDYVVYGQTLNIQRGRILFGGGPIDNPRLDMDVARRVEAYDVTAGARVRGTALAPLLQLYSEPSMPDASILSFILLGQPPGTKGGSYTLGKYVTPDLYVSYGIGLFNAINTFNLRYKLTEKLSLHATSGAASGADLIYTFER
ncbi:MAG: translocation/assembly module TamB domain-containing protein [Thiotrichales bacterium]